MTLMYYNLFLNVRIKECIIKQFIDVFLFDSIHDQYKTHQKSDLAVSLYPFLIVHYLDIYVSQRMG